MENYIIPAAQSAVIKNAVEEKAAAEQTLARLQQEAVALNNKIQEAGGKITGILTTIATMYGLDATKEIRVGNDFGTISGFPIVLPAATGDAAPDAVENNIEENAE